MSPMSRMKNDDGTTQGTLHLQKDIRLSQVYAKKAAPLKQMIPRTFSTSSQTDNEAAQTILYPMNTNASIPDKDLVVDGTSINCSPTRTFEPPSPALPLHLQQMSHNAS